MGNYFKSLCLLLFSFLLVACLSSNGQNTSKHQKPNDGYVRLIVKEDTNTIDEKVPFQKGDTVMEILKENYKVKEEKGFIKAIDNYHQDEKKQVYWFFKVNDKMASKGADALQVKKGDVIYFYLDSVK